MRLSMGLTRILITLLVMLSVLAHAQEQDSTSYTPVDSVAIANFFESYVVKDTVPNDVEVKEYIALRHKQYSDSLVLRWAPTTRSLLVKGNKLGYVVKRYEYPYDPDTLSEQDEEMIITAPASLSNPIKAYDSAQWATVFPTDDKYAIIAAGATTGSLDVNADEVGFGVKAQQDESIYGFTLLAADLSVTAANGLGLRYVDKTVQKGTTYEYRVCLADSAEVAKMDSLMNLSYENLDSTQVIGWVAWLDEQADGYVEFQGKTEAMFLKEFRTSSLENAVELRWPVVPNDQYSAFFIERSSDGGTTFDTLTQNVLVSEPIEVFDSLGNNFSYYKYVDRLDENYVSYTYKITGLDGFGDKSETATASGMGRDLTPPANPQLISGEYRAKKQQVHLIWRTPAIPADFGSFYLQRRDAPTAVWSTIEPALGTSDTTYSFIPEPHQYSHYFRLGIKDTAGNAAYSFPVFVSIPDTIAPPAPTQLMADIDTTGQVRLTWEQEIPGGERLLGYRVYYSNRKSHEFTQLTTTPVANRSYSYSIPLKTLTDKIYYKVQSVDNHYNHSEFSEVIEAQKPDILPPVAPVFKNPLVTESYVELNWEPSSSKDVIAQEITRTRSGSDESPAKFMVEKGNRSYYDSTADKGVVYRYTIAAIDDDNLRSKESFPVQARVIDKKLMDQVSSLEANYNDSKNSIELKWVYDERGDYRFMIYRNFGNDKVKRYRSVGASENTFEDGVKDPGTYYYAIKVVEKSGKKSVLSEVVAVSTQ